MFKDIYKNRRMIYKLAKNDFKTRYAGSMFGTVWAVVQPLVTIAVYYFVFGFGFRGGQNVGEVPFVLYLVAGIVPWFYFSEALTNGTSSMLEYSYLVKKVVFNIQVLPVVKLVSATFVHLIFIVIAFLLFAFFGRFPDLYCLQIVYYFACLAILTLALSYTTSAVVVLFRDLGQIVNILLQVGVWLTPIMYDVNMMFANHPWVPRVLRLNPVYYVVNGYRDALINKRWFWEEPEWTIYFWVLTILLFLFGRWVFQRLRVHFADVL
ncbi:MAG: ABC transporter permease [Candidatus Limivivens sp.]|nr:ABC transporter permease [Candidatus Limivivens sp.]